MKRRDIRIGVSTTVLPKRRTLHGAVVTAPILHFRRMAKRAAEKGALLMLFSPQDIHWEQGTVQAWVPKHRDHPMGHWVRTSMPLPHVIYENVFVHLAMKGYASGMRKQARQRGIPVFNPPLYGKWTMSTWLSRTDAKQYVPPAVLCRDQDKVMRAVEQWSETYLKPIGGYGGMGVTRIQVADRGKYRVSVDRQKNGSKERKIVTKSELAALIRKRMRQPHFLQKGLRLMTVGDRKVDFRVVVHRGEQGAWHVVGIVPKLAAADGVVTNIVAGGERLSLEQLVSLAAREGKNIPRHDLETCALAVAKNISNKFANVGLLGFDLGVDQTGRVWLIEVNPKPARSLLNDEMKQKTAQYVTDFAIYLAEAR